LADAQVASELDVPKPKCRTPTQLFTPSIAALSDESLVRLDDYWTIQCTNFNPTWIVTSTTLLTQSLAPAVHWRAKRFSAKTRT
jgi:hypothetical protein